MPEIGRRGQLRLKNASVLVVGTGGLGCAAALYLAGAGIGHIGLVDNDHVELNNLHRQLLHPEAAIGTPKALSGQRTLLAHNSDIRVTVHAVQLTSANAMALLADYAVIVDATDNVPTRYLINDACVLLGRPLVSGSALRLEGQLTVYHHRAGPCYRCVFPVPTPQAAVTNCGDAGVLGAVVGVIGTLQALEVIKIVLGEGEGNDGDDDDDGTLAGTLLMFDAERTAFRRIRLRGRNPQCAVCSGPAATIRQLIDYEQFCAARASDKVHDIAVLGPEQRISADDLRRVVQCPVPPTASNEAPWLLIDVRTATEFDIGSITGAVNVPIEDILGDRLTVEMRDRLLADDGGVLFVVCRRGNDSQRAVQRLSEMDAAMRRREVEETPVLAGVPMTKRLRRKKSIRDLVGGLTEWHRVVDDTFPIY